MPRPDRTSAGSDRAAKLAKIKKAGNAAERRRSGLIWGAAGLVVVLIVGLVTFAVVRDSPALVDLADDVEVYENQGMLHTTDPVDYEIIPPVGGEHHGAWWNCGVYQEEIPMEHAVHSLEHGAVWLTYQPDLPADQIEVLEDLGNQDYMLVSPLAEQEDPIVATSWDHQMSLDEADDRMLRAFISEYKQGMHVPEPGGLCTNGTVIDMVNRG